MDAYELLELFDEQLGELEIEGNYYNKGEVLQILDPDHYDHTFADWVSERYSKTDEETWELNA